MGKIIRNGVIYTGSSDEADKIHYKNSNSDLDSTTVQGALDELANEMLPKTGGTMEGVLWTGNGSENGYGYINSNDNLIQLGSTNAVKDATFSRSLELFNSNYQANVARALHIADSKGDETAYYLIHGEHNKPTGSYTGTGSADVRYIKTGGIGRIIVITSIKGTAILTTTGGLTFNSLGVNGVIDTAVKLNSTNGEIMLATTNMFFNEVDLVYTYQFL